MLWEARPDGEIDYFNQEWLSFTGLTLAQASGGGWAQALHPDEAADARQQWAQAVQSGAPYEAELRLRRFDGEYRHFLVKAVPTRDAEGKIAHWYGVSADITARKQAEAALEQQQARIAELQATHAALEKALHAKDEFTAAMNHELHAPLSGILGLTDILLENTYGDLNPKQQKALQNIESSGSRLLKIVNEVLDIAQLQSGQLNLQISACSLAEICSASLRTVQIKAAAKKQRLNFSISPKNITLNADGERLKQILVSLLDNAVKFTPAQGRISLSAVLLPAGDQVQISVADTGMGIKEEDLPRLFHPFVQLDARLSRLYEGTGLGLVIVKALVELHGGKISLESVFGQGSRFIILLPYPGGLS